MKRLVIAAILLAALAGAVLPAGAACDDEGPDADVAPTNLIGAASPSPTAPTFTQVSAGSFHTCGVKTDGTVACWGDNKYEQATPPAGSFTQVSAGGFHTCGVKTDGTVVCWGDNEDGQATPPTASQTAAWSATSPTGPTSPT